MGEPSPDTSIHEILRQGRQLLYPSVPMFTAYNDLHTNLVMASLEAHSESHTTGTTGRLCEPMIYLSSDCLSISFSVTSDKQLRTTP